ncbi:unnamed protein product [Amoebophrya sp. A120]|nr:unnamed protein product [Amoebophrya sp. A120]|eukprot:GSA120T00022553001.1
MTVAVEAEELLRDLSRTQISELHDRYDRCEEQLAEMREKARDSMVARKKYIENLSDRLLDKSEKLTELRAAQTAGGGLAEASENNNKHLNDLTRAASMQTLLRSEILRYERTTDTADAHSRENLRLVRELFQHSLSLHDQLKNELERAAEKEEQWKQEKLFLEQEFEKQKENNRKLVKELQNACEEVADLEKKSCETGEEMHEKFTKFSEQNVQQLEQLEEKYVQKLTDLNEDWQLEMKKEKQDRAREVSEILSEKQQKIAEQEAHWTREFHTLQTKLQSQKKDHARTREELKSSKEREKELKKQVEELKQIGNTLEEKLSTARKESQLFKKHAQDWRNRVESLQAVGGYGKRGERNADQFLLVQKQVRDLREELHLHQAVRDITLQEYQLKSIRDAATAVPAYPALGVEPSACAAGFSTTTSANDNLFNIADSTTTPIVAAAPTSPVTARTNLLKSGPVYVPGQQSQSSQMITTPATSGALPLPVPSATTAASVGEATGYRDQFLDPLLTYCAKNELRQEEEQVVASSSAAEPQEGRGPTTTSGKTLKHEDETSSLEHKLNVVSTGKEVLELRENILELEMQKLRQEVVEMKRTANANNSGGVPQRPPLVPPVAEVLDDPLPTSRSARPPASPSGAARDEQPGGHLLPTGSSSKTTSKPPVDISGWKAYMSPPGFIGFPNCDPSKSSASPGQDDPTSTSADPQVAALQRELAAKNAELQALREGASKERTKVKVGTGASAPSSSRRPASSTGSAGAAVSQPLSRIPGATQQMTSELSNFLGHDVHGSSSPRGYIPRASSPPALSATTPATTIQQSQLFRPNTGTTTTAITTMIGRKETYNLDTPALFRPPGRGAGPHQTGSNPVQPTLSSTSRPPVWARKTASSRSKQTSKHSNVDPLDVVVAAGGAANSSKKTTAAGAVTQSRTVALGAAPSPNGTTAGQELQQVYFPPGPSAVDDLASSASAQARQGSKLSSPAGPGTNAARAVMYRLQGPDELLQQLDGGGRAGTTTTRSLSPRQHTAHQRGNSNPPPAGGTSKPRLSSTIGLMPMHRNRFVAAENSSGSAIGTKMRRSWEGPVAPSATSSPRLQYDTKLGATVIVADMRSSGTISGASASSRPRAGSHGANMEKQPAFVSHSARLIPRTSATIAQLQGINRRAHNNNPNSSSRYNNSSARDDAGAPAAGGASTSSRVPAGTHIRLPVPLSAATTPLGTSMGAGQHLSAVPTSARESALRDSLNEEKWKYRVQRQELRQLQEELARRDRFQHRLGREVQRRPYCSEEDELS